MLQQTQTSRVIEKYLAFIKAFPDFETLANAPQSEVLKLWQGLGYNRRALYLLRSAQTICSDVSIHNYKKFTPEYLQSLPGIGPNTAGAIYVFSYDKPHVFIETNIRRVFIHEFFADSLKVSDKQIIPLIESALPKDRNRDWYYALMDYGAYLAKTETNPNRRSKHYTKQSKFEGSLRQVRGKILKELLNGPQSENELIQKINAPLHLKKALHQLENEGFIKFDKSKFQLAS